MQAATHSRHMEIGRTGTWIAAVGIAAMLALAAAGLVVTDNLPAVGSDDEIVLVKAHYAPGMGEGLVGDDEIVLVKAHYAPGMGEGLVGGPLVDITPSTSQVNDAEGGTVPYDRPEGVSIHFWEINQLPTEDIQMLPPYNDGLGTVY